MRPENPDQFKVPKITYLDSGIVEILAAGEKYEYAGLDPDSNTYSIKDKDGQIHRFTITPEGAVSQSETDSVSDFVDPEVTKRRRNEAEHALKIYLEETKREARDIWDKAA